MSYIYYNANPDGNYIDTTDTGNEVLIYYWRKI